MALIDCRWRLALAKSIDPLLPTDESSDEDSLIEALVATERSRRREVLRVADEVAARTSGRQHTDSVLLIREGRTR